MRVTPPPGGGGGRAGDGPRGAQGEGDDVQRGIGRRAGADDAVARDMEIVGAPDLSVAVGDPCLLRAEAGRPHQVQAAAGRRDRQGEPVRRVPDGVRDGGVVGDRGVQPGAVLIAEDEAGRDQRQAPAVAPFAVEDQPVAGVGVDPDELADVGGLADRHAGGEPGDLRPGRHDLRVGAAHTARRDPYAERLVVARPVEQVVREPYARADHRVIGQVPAERGGPYARGVEDEGGAECPCGHDDLAGLDAQPAPSGGVPRDHGRRAAARHLDAPDGQAGNDGHPARGSAARR
ncbi:hypothetical protein [Streptomyces sp. RFCAC02]|uniref:hypothetical protein n=1 Tax=Streptomyces sp. RFCAC02 TaxID=2499143 RepID=UPI001F0DA575|nr:hypothetical protein [Streptomyces sp. RFCAC02]